MLTWSSQYLWTPVLESCRTWYSGCSWRVDDPYWFWGHKVKVKLLVLEKYVVCTISFDPFAWKLLNLVQWMPQGVDDLYWFWGHMVKGQTADIRKNVVCSIFLNPFTWKFLNLVQWMLLASRWLLLMFRLHGRRSRSTVGLNPQCYLPVLNV